MWILDTEGSFLQGKRVWLRPGKKYLFGRYKTEGVREAIPERTISRKHLVIDVSEVAAGDGSKIRARTSVTVSDEGSKFGTVVDGEQIKGSSRTLTGEEHTINLGKYAHALRIKWQPVVLSFSFSSKESNKNAIAGFRSRLENFDIKTIEDYLPSITTHVVQTKRNTAKGLQALVNGAYIVDYSFVDALDYAGAPDDLENEESLSPLEQDFEAAWPEAREHLPPPGKEISNASDEAFAPNPDRTNVFEGYTFIFCDSSQHQILQEPINSGHGKALFFEVEEQVTTVEEVVQFMRDASGQKGVGSERDAEGGVVFVRFHSKAHDKNWAIQLEDDVALMTDQRAIQQNEFLSAILGNDASILCRRLREELVPESSEPTPAPSSSEDVQVVVDSQPPEEASEPPKRAKGTRVRKYVSKMKTFDDGFDINSIPAYAPNVEESIEDLPPMAIDEPPEEQTQKIDSFQEEEDVVSSLLPGANAMKRRRAETSQRSLGESSTRPKPESAPRPKRQKLDVLEAARQHREAEEDAARQRRQQEDELLQTSLQDVDVEKLKGLAIVEEMELPERPADDNNRWDERWNGRKNFKKFCRKGDPSQQRRRIQTVIVPLEEVARKDFGIGDHYWVSNSRSSGPSAPESRLEREISDVESEPSQQPSVPRSESRTTATQRSQKRPREVQDSDSDDELKFRFRRRR